MVTDIDIRWDGRWFGFHIEQPRKWGLGVRSRYISFGWLSITIGYCVGKRRKQVL